MMQTMRENTKWIMLAVAVAFVALMVFEWGMDLTGQSGAQLSGGDVGRVNGDIISYEQFNYAYRNLYDQQSQYTSGPIGSAMNKQIEDAAFDQIVMQHLIAQELRRRGIVVTNEEIVQAARYEPPPEFQGNPLFMTDGQFDLAKYHQYMASPAVDRNLLVQLEAYYRDAIPRSKLYYQQTAGLYVTDEQLWRMWRDTRDSVTVRYLAFDAQATVPDEGITVSDAEISQYYQAHQTDFLRAARATVKYITIDARPNAADTAAALARVQKIRQDIIGGEDFAELARIESSDSVSAAQGGLLTVQKGQTVPAFDQAAFSQAVGTVGEPVLSQYGYHLIKVESRTGDEAEVRHILIPIELSFEHEDAVFEVADSVEALSETVKLDEIGRQLGIDVQQTDLIPGLGIIPGVGEIADGADWAFRTAQPGEISQVFETPATFYALELVDRQDERTQTLDEARETIRAALTMQKKVERTTQTAREAVDRIRSGQSMEEVAQEFGLAVQDAGPFSRSDFVPGLGRMNAAVGAAFGLQPGQTSGAVEAENTVYVIRTTARVDADRAAWEAQKQDQRRQVTQAMAQQSWERYLEALLASARIVDDREEFFRQSAEAAAALGN